LGVSQAAPPRLRAPQGPVRGTNSIGLSYTSFGLTLIGGLTTATLLTLLLVPVFHTCFDDATIAVGAALRHALRRAPSGEAEGGAATGV
jgi:hypothetical protein